MKTKGMLFWKKEWYSICSKHKNHKEDCLRCNTGYWINTWMNRVSNFIFKNFPDLWRWWVNKNE